MPAGVPTGPEARESGTAASPRVVFAWLATLALGGLAGPVLGEYEFHGAFSVGAGILTALLLGEVCVGVARGRSIGNGVVTVAAAAGGLLLAGWFASSRGIDAFPGGAWVAAILGAVTGWLRAGPWLLSPRRGDRS